MTFVFEPSFSRIDINHEISQWNEAKNEFRRKPTYESAERFILTTLSLLKAGEIGNDEYRAMLGAVSKWIE